MLIKLPNMDYPGEKLLSLARAAREAAYAPYSGFRVGAALLTTRGLAYKGCNVENASFGLTVCAERVALFKAVSEGEREFAALAVTAGTVEYCLPCGACLQVLAEFNPQLTVLMGNSRGEYLERRVAELLPLAFRLSPVRNRD